MGGADVTVSMLPETTNLDAESEVRAIVARVRTRTLRLVAWSDQRRHRPAELGDRWADREDLARWSQTDERGRSLSTDVAGADRAATPRLEHLGVIFGLDAREQQFLAVCLAAALDPSSASSLAIASGRPLPTEALIATLLDHDVARVLTPDSPLLRWELVRRVPIGPDTDGIAVDPGIADWFTGAYSVEPELVGIARAIAPPSFLVERWPVDPIANEIRTRWARRDVAPYVRVVIIGPTGSGRRTFAAAVADRLGIGLLAIDGAGIDDTTWRRTSLRAHRQAYLTQHAIAFVGDVASRHGQPHGVAAFPLTFLCVEPGGAFGLGDAGDLVVELPSPQAADRSALWKRLVPAAARWPADALETLAQRHRALPGDIAMAAARGVDSIEDATQLARERGRGRLGELATRIDAAFTWQDLVLPSTILDLLHDFAFEAQERSRVWESAAIRRLFPHGRGLFALFTGLPGTGKTMAAQVISNELGLDLYRISLATVISKYVGETAKNLERILVRAETMDAVLLFDEADALFGKRTEIKDAQDRFANSDTNHLLQAIENYAGIAILASNKKANVDPAFMRRLRYVIELPRPDQPHRRMLWTRLVAEMCGDDTAQRLGSLFDAAATIEVTAAQIKYAVLGAVFVARRDGCAIGAPQLLRGLERELHKEGRSLSDREKERLIRA